MAKIVQNVGTKITPQQARQEISAMLGQQYEGDRDYYLQAGYPKEVAFEAYLAMYRRGDIASRIVNEPANETWRKWPEVLDGLTLGDATTDTAFVEEWQTLVAGRFEVEREQLGIFHYLTRLDIRSGIGQYGGLFIGANDGAASAADPLLPGSARGLDGLLYLTVFDEGQMEIDTTNEDAVSPRFGLPEMYNLKTEDGDQKCHWTRIVHIAEDAEILGVSRLEGVFNRLEDIGKIMAASGESAWRLMVPRMASLAREGFQQGDTEAMDEQFQNFIHGLTKVLSLEGVDVEEFAGAIVDPSGALGACLRLISGTTRIPQRKLIGAEAGELASGQDEENWITVIEGRRLNHAEPVILKRVISRLVYAGILTAPTQGIIVKWPALREIDRLQLADLGNKAADALIKMGFAPDQVDYMVAYFPDLDAQKMSEGAVGDDPEVEIGGEDYP